MNEIAVADALHGLLGVGIDSVDREGLEQAARWNATLKSFTAWIDVRVTRRGNELSTNGLTDDGYATIAKANGSGRDAKAAVERDRACETVPQLGDALAAGEVSGEHLDVLAKHTKHLTPEERADVSQRADDLLKSATSGSAWSFDRYAKTLVNDIRERHRPNSDADELEQQRQRSDVKRWTEQSTGMKCTLVKLDPLADAQWWSVIDATLATMRQDPNNAKIPFRVLKARAVVAAATGRASGWECPKSTSTSTPTRPSRVATTTRCAS